MAKRNKGRQKVEMVKMQNESNLQVTFSKRRAGLFKKANEICVLCGTEVLLIVFSPGERVYSFGHPSVGSIIDRYLGNSPPAVNANYAIQAHRNANLRELNEQLSQLEKRMEDEKKRAEALEKSKKEDQDKHWWKAPVGELSPRQLLQFQKALEGLKDNIDKEMRERMMQSSSASRYLAERGYFGRNSGPSNAVDIPFVARPPYELPAPSGLSLFVDHEDIDLNRKASGSGSLDMPDESEHCHVHKFF